MSVCPFADQSYRFDGAYPASYVPGPERRGLLHTTESTGLPGYKGGASAPHFTLVPNIAKRTSRTYQHFSTGRPARALRNEPGGVQTNNERVIQIELVGTCDSKYRKTWPTATGVKVAGRDYIFWPEAPAWALDELKVLMRWIEEDQGVPRVSTARPWLPYPESYGRSQARMTFTEWDWFSGWCGHQHAPENAHGDPANINITYLLNTADPTPEEDIMATLAEVTEALRGILRQEIMDAPVTREGGLDGSTTLRTTLAYLDGNLSRVITAQSPEALATALDAALSAQGVIVADLDALTADVADRLNVTPKGGE